MNTPSGYTALDLIGFTDRGAYDSTANYVKNDLTHDLSNKIWRCLIDDTHGVTPVEGVNWTLFIDSQTALSGMSDVQITTPTTGEALVYDGTASKWKNELLADVALSGDYGDLINLPTLGTAAAKDSTNAVTQGSTDLVESGAVYSGLANKANTADLATVATSGAYSDLSGTPSLATVATSGSYNDLLNKPTLGTAAAKDSTNAVTQNSTDLVESGAVYTQVSQLKNAFTNQVHAADAKNLYTFETYSQTLNSVAFTVNDDLSISTADTSGSGNTILKVGTLAKGLTNVNLSGCPSGGSQNAWCLQLYDVTINDYLSAETGSGKKYTLDATHEYQIRIVIRASQNMSGKTFKPMITLSTTPDSDYAHYAPPAKTNYQLTTDKVGMDLLSEVGGVNYCKTDIVTQTLGGVTVTANADGSYSCVGNVSANSNNRADATSFKLKKGTYIFYCSANAHDPIGSDNCFAFIYGINGTSSWTRSYKTNAGSDGSCGVITLTQDSTITFGICCYNNTGSAVAVNTTFYPGIYPVSYNGPYAPHAKTNWELTDFVTPEYFNLFVRNNRCTILAQKNCKIGKQVYIWCLFTSLLDQVDVPVLTIPEGYRPPNLNSDMGVALQLIPKYSSPDRTKYMWACAFATGEIDAMSMAQNKDYMLCGSYVID